MARDGRSIRLPLAARPQDTPGLLITPGPFIATIKNNLDPTYMGRLEVFIDSQGALDENDSKNWRQVSYLSPFYGVTAYPPGNNNEFNQTQKSYGMWMVPPDVGTKVLVIFAEGNPNLGFWIGCIPDMFMNNMIPGIAGDVQKNKSDPVAEYNKNVYTSVTEAQTATKPTHPFSARLKIQGLDKDPVRGTTTSSARRESPSNVFGISTPGPVDEANSPLKKQYPDFNLSSPTVSQGGIVFPSSRLGGHSFVMDDGDVSHNNELVRIRSRTGHQLLMHDTKGIIYLGNAEGTVWIEFTASGKIDIYAKDSVSFHSEKDFNFHATGNVNIEALQSVNIKSGITTNVNAQEVNILSSKNTRITATTGLHVKAKDTLYLEGASAFNLKGGSTGSISASKININSGSSASAQEAKPIQVQTTSTGINSIISRIPLHEPWPEHDVLEDNAQRKPQTVAVVNSFTATPVKIAPSKLAQVETPALRDVVGGKKAQQFQGELLKAYHQPTNSTLNDSEKFNTAFNTAMGSTYGISDIAAFQKSLPRINDLGINENSIFSEWKSKLGDTFNQSFSAVSNVVKDVTSEVSSITKDVTSGISSVVKDVTSGIGDTVSDVASDIGISDIASDIGDAASDAFNFVKRNVSDINFDKAQLASLIQKNESLRGTPSYNTEEAIQQRSLIASINQRLTRGI